MASKFRILATVGSAFHDVRRVLTALPLLSAYAALVSLASYSVSLSLQPADPASVLNDVTAAAAIIPFSIGVYRFLLLDEVGSERDRTQRRRRLWSFLGATLLVSLASSLLLTLAIAGESLIIAVTSVVAAIAGLVLLTTWLPAIAVDHSAPHLLDAAREAYPIFFRLLGAVLLSLVIVMIPMIVMISFFPFLEAIVGGAVTFLIVTVCLSISAQALRWARQARTPQSSAIATDLSA